MPADREKKEVNITGGFTITEWVMKEVIITGGERARTLVSVYSEAGWQRDLAPLTGMGRSDHACSSFTNAGEKVICNCIRQQSK